MIGRPRKDQTAELSLSRVQIVQRCRKFVDDDAVLSELARRAGVPTHKAIRLIQRGIIPPLNDDFLRLCNVMQANAEYVRNGTGHPYELPNYAHIEYLDGKNYIQMNGQRFLLIGASLDNLVATVVPDRSMHPTLEQGNQVIIDTGAALSDGIYAFKIGEALSIRRAFLFEGSLSLRPENPDYQEMHLDLREERNFSLIGRVIWSEKWL